jgi:hypothetical protein
VHAVSNDGADTITSHLARRVRDDAVLVVQLHAEAPIGVNLVDNAFDGEQLFLCQRLSQPDGAGYVADVVASTIGNPLQQRKASDAEDARYLIAGDQAKLRPELMYVAVCRGHRRIP